MLRTIFSWLLVGLLPTVLFAQAPLTLKDIWASRALAPDQFPGFQWHKGGAQYLEYTQRGLVAYDTRTGKEAGLIVPAAELMYQGQALEPEGFALSDNGAQMLLSVDQRPVYRRSSTARAYVLDMATRKIVRLDTGRVQNTTLSPDGRLAAFARRGNVYVVDVATGAQTQVTRDGEPGKILNGVCDWVYEEEFEFAQALYWSPDSKRLAFYRFDESRVPEYDLQYWRGAKALYPEEYRYKYPKAGEPNSAVSIQIYEPATSKSLTAQTGSGDIYLARVKWTTDPALLSIIRMNRLQNKLELLHCQAATGACQAAYTEQSQTYVEVNDNLLYLPQTGKKGPGAGANSGGFVLTSERDGYRHAYLYTMEGKLLRQLTKGRYEVAKLHGISAGGQLYYSAHARNPMNLEVYGVALAGSAPRLLSPEPGSHEADFAPGMDFFTDAYSTFSDPGKTLLREATGKTVKTLVTNDTLRARLAALGLPGHEFLQVPSATDSLKLNAWMMRPKTIEPGRRYPVLMYCYGGPGANTVENQFAGPNYYWFCMLAQQGYIIVSVDNRGTGARGAAFSHATYGQLGRLESDDQAAAARHLATLPYVDAARIGIWGWSFGGYLTSLCLARFPEVFKAGLAVAPVTNWRYYDSIYTERYLGLPQDNAKGYDDNSPAVLAKSIKARYLLVHGTGDDNVHFQNAVQMANTLISANIPFDQAYYPDRHHGITGGGARLHLYGKMTAWLGGNL